jgi:hypothetical protein
LISKREDRVGEERRHDLWKDRVADDLPPTGADAGDGLDHSRIDLLDRVGEQPPQASTLPIARVTTPGNGPTPRAATRRRSTTISGSARSTAITPRAGARSQAGEKIRGAGEPEEDRKRHAKRRRDRREQQCYKCGSDHLGE